LNAPSTHYQFSTKAIGGKRWGGRRFLACFASALIMSFQVLDFKASGRKEFRNAESVAFGDTAFGAEQTDRWLQPVQAADEQVAGAMDKRGIALREE
jgi:hypothetical protein